MLCLISYHNVRKLSRQSVLTPVSFTAHGHMFALPSFSEPIASFGRLKPRVSGDENVDTGGYSKMFYLETTRIRLKMKTNVCLFVCFFLTPPPPLPFPLPIAAFLSLASLYAAQTTTRHPESKHFSLLLFPF